MNRKKTMLIAGGAIAAFLAVAVAVVAGVVVFTMTRAPQPLSHLPEYMTVAGRMETASFSGSDLHELVKDDPGAFSGFDLMSEWDNLPGTVDVIEFGAHIRDFAGSEYEFVAVLLGEFPENRYLSLIDEMGFDSDGTYEGIEIFRYSSTWADDTFSALVDEELIVLANNLYVLRETIDVSKGEAEGFAKQYPEMARAVAKRSEDSAGLAFTLDNQITQMLGEITDEVESFISEADRAENDWIRDAFDLARACRPLSWGIYEISFQSPFENSMLLVFEDDESAQTAAETGERLKGALAESVRTESRNDAQALDIADMLEAISIDVGGNRVQVQATWNVPMQESSGTEAEATACRENLKMIDGAMQQYLLEENLRDWNAGYDALGGTKWGWLRLVGADNYLRREPVCPSGGSYSIEPANTQEPGVTCSHERHDPRHSLNYQD